MKTTAQYEVEAKLASLLAVLGINKLSGCTEREKVVTVAECIIATAATLKPAVEAMRREINADNARWAALAKDMADA